MTTYSLKEGTHYSLHLPKFCYNRKELDVEVRFHKTCWFPLILPDDYAINKLVGWSFGRHHKNSFRCGWRPAGKEGYIDLFFYIYNDGERFEKFLATIQCGNTYGFKMKWHPEGCISIGASEKEVLVGGIFFNKAPKLGYFLFPYFGGKNPTPHDMKIDLDFK